MLLKENAQKRTHASTHVHVRVPEGREGLRFSCADFGFSPESSPTLSVPTEAVPSLHLPDVYLVRGSVDDVLVHDLPEEHELLLVPPSSIPAMSALRVFVAVDPAASFVSALLPIGRQPGFEFPDTVGLEPAAS